MNNNLRIQTIPVSVLLPEVLVEGVDHVARAEFSDRSAIIRQAVKSYLVTYAEDELSEDHRRLLKSRAEERDTLIPYAQVRRELRLTTPSGSKKATRTSQRKGPSARR